MKKRSAARRGPRKKEPVVVPKEYGGQWIAWNREHTAIIGHGVTLAEARQRALATGEEDPGYEWVPPANCRIVGVLP